MNNKKIQSLSDESLENVVGGVAETGDSGGEVEYEPGPFKDEANVFLREHMDKNIYAQLAKNGMNQPVVAKLYLNSSDWKKYVWIEKHGSLTCFKG